MLSNNHRLTQAWEVGFLVVFWLPVFYGSLCVRACYVCMRVCWRTFVDACGSRSVLLNWLSRAHVQDWWCGMANLLISRFSDFLLYWYKSTNTDAASAVFLGFCLVVLLGSSQHGADMRHALCRGKYIIFMHVCVCVCVCVCVWVCVCVVAFSFLWTV